MAALVFPSLSPRRKKALKWFASLGLFCTTLGFFMLPPLIREVAVKQLSKQLDRPVTIQQIRCNPFTLSATVQGLLVMDKDGQPLLAWDEAYLNFQLASFRGKAWTFREVIVTEPFVRVQINKDYTLTFADIVDRLGPRAERGSAPGQSRGWKIERLRFRGARVAFTDLTPREPFQRIVGPFDLTLNHFKTDSDNKNPYTFSGRTDGGEQIAWQGFFYLNPIRSEGEFSLQGLRLTNYAALYQDAVRFAINDGVINVHAGYHYEKSAARQLLSVTGTTLNASSLKVTEKLSGQPVLDISRCLVSGATLDALARRAEVDSLSVSDGRLVLYRNKDTSVNVVELVKPIEGAPHTPGGIILLLRAMTNLVAVLLSTTNLSTGVIRDVHLTNCAVHVEDLAKGRPVRLDLDLIAVNARNVSNRAGSNMVAEVKMRWATNSAVRADINAGLCPPRAQVKLTLEKLDLRPLAAYLEPYMGYELKQATFSLNTIARLTEQKLNSQNRITLDQVALGDPLDNPAATKLPVRLAIALLKDRNGRIELEVPVDGSLADPEFHLGDVISSAIGSVFSRIVTSPFSALSAIFGGKGESLSFQEFEPGSTNLLPATKEKLDVVVNGLIERPEVLLEIEGGADAKTDREALRSGHWGDVEHFPNWKTGGTVNEIAVTGSFLKAVVDEKGGAALMRMALADSLPAEGRLAETMDDSPSDLQALAAERARNVQAYLLQTGKVAAERMSIAKAGRHTPANARRVYLRLQ